MNLQSYNHKSYEAYETFGFIRPLFQGNIIRSEYFLYQALRERNESQGHSDGDGTQGHPDDDGYLRRLHRGEEAGSDQEDGR